MPSSIYWHSNTLHYIKKHIYFFNVTENKRRLHANRQINLYLRGIM